MLADNGYFSEANVQACVAGVIEPLIALGREAHHPSLQERFAAAPPAPEDPTPVQAMAYRLRTPQGSTQADARASVWHHQVRAGVLGRQGDWQGDLVVTWQEMPRSPGHVFYDRLQGVLIDAGFDAFAETTCKPYYAAKMGAPSIPPGRYFRMHARPGATAALKDSRSTPIPARCPTTLGDTGGVL